MTAAVVQTQAFSWAGNYPLGFSQAIAAMGSGTTGALYFFSTGPSYDTTSLRPTLTYAGKTGVYIGGFSNSSGGTLWAWYVDAPAASGTLSIALANNYIGDGRATIVSLSGTATAPWVGATSFVGITATGGTAISSLVTTSTSSLVIDFVMGIYGGTPSVDSSSPAVTSVFSDDTVSDRRLRVYRQLPVGSGTTDSVNWNCTYNYSVNVSIEILGGGGGAPTSSTGVSTGNLTLTAVEAGTVATPVSSSTASLTLASSDTGTVAVTGTSTGNLTLTAVEGTGPNEQLVLALADVGARFSLTRTGAATYFDSTKTLVAVAAGSPRLWSELAAPLGIMTEEAGSNGIMDNTGATAVVAGAFPTGGSFYNGGITGFTCAVAAIGTEDGIPYVDYRFQGSNSSGSIAYPSLSISTPTAFGVTAGDVVAFSAYMRYSAGTYLRPAGGATQYPMAALQCNSVDGTGAYVSSLPNAQPIFDNDHMVRDWSGFTVPTGAGAYLNPLIALNIPDGMTFDFTVRLGLPQLEKTARPTSPIKTTGTGASRGIEAMSYLTSSATKDIYVERVNYTGLSRIDLYAAQVVTGGAWPVPAVAEFPIVRRLSSTGALSARAKAVTTATAKGWNLGVSFKLSDYTAHSDYAAIIKAEASIYGAEYELKMDQLQPTTEGTFTYAVADNFVAQAATDGKLVRGHCLIWYAATPSWCSSVLTSSPTTARWQGIIDSHISNVIARYSQCNVWDVVNEVLEPNDLITGGFRNSVWYQGCGSAYIAYAFQRARAYNTTSKLHIAEYGTEENDSQGAARRSALLALITSLQSASVPIDGVSLQCHLDIERPFSASVWATFLQSLKTMGLNVVLSEVDIRAPDQDSSLEYDIRAARRLREVLDTFTANTSGTDILFWDYGDTYTWLTAQFPSRTERPLPFDTSLTPKAMYAALQQEFESIAPTAGATGSSTGTQSATLNLTKVEAGSVSLTGTSTGALQLTRVDTGKVTATGTQTKPFALTAVETGIVPATGTQTKPFALTAVDAGTVPATGTSTGNFALTAAGTATVSVTGVQTSNVALSAVDAGSVAISGTSNAGLACLSVESGNAPASGTSTGGLSLSDISAGGVAVTASLSSALSLTSSDAGDAAATANLASTLNLTSSDAGTVVITGTSTGALQLTAFESLGSENRGTSTGNFALTAPNDQGVVPETAVGGGGLNLTSSDTGTVALTGSQTAVLALTAAGTGTVADAGSQTTTLSLTAAGTGTLSATGIGAGGFVFTCSQTGTMLAVGTSSANLTLAAFDTGSAIPISNGAMTAAFALRNLETGSSSITGSSFANLVASSADAGTVGLQGSGQGNFGLSSVENSSLTPLSTGLMQAYFTLTAVDSAVVSLTGASTGALHLTAADTGSMTATGNSVGGFQFAFSLESGWVSVTGVQIAGLTVSSVNAGANATHGTQMAALALASSEGAVSLDAGNQAALIVLTAVQASSAIGSGNNTSGFLLTRVQTAAIPVQGLQAASLAATSSEAGSSTVTGAQAATVALTASESSQQVATLAGSGAFILSSVQAAGVAIAGVQASSIRALSSDVGTVLAQGSSTGAVKLASVDTATLLSIGQGSGGLALSAIQGAGLLNPIQGTSTAALSVTAGGAGEVLIQADLAPASFRFGGSGALQVLNQGNQHAGWSMAMAASGGVMIAGDSVSTLIVASFAASFSDNNIKGQGNITFDAAMRGVVITIGSQLPPSSGRMASTTRVDRTAVVARVDSVSSSYLSRTAKVS